ncbi:MnuA family membrane nuclease [Mycoplasma nasistruthionis]|uniref:Endonuclease/exonuclease/phosphatase domain-containing protein n=1 Tax=Mycoplasma nasistruthionis TaxID=353852 RepID=A0A4Y6I550_9MOLU|nr:endonuclease/exonuclease/phosphatase family protein [Mycoplasma nasistruthionis]QDF64725.1 hypothetical protein FIV53_00035 [Mycoplasma nasistruthionis]
MKYKKTISTIISTTIVLGAAAYGAYYGFTKLNQKDNVANNQIVNDNKNSLNVSSAGYEKNYDHRIVSWNIYNFSNSTGQFNTNKLLNVATTLNLLQPDIVGLTEISFNDTKAIENIKSLLNKPYQSILGNSLNSTYPTKKESVAILYNPEVFELITSGTLNPENGYVRPLFYGRFQNKVNNKHLITIFGHFDSPDNGNGEENGALPGQGAWEEREAKLASNVFADLKRQFPDDDIVLGADTNIKTSNDKAFKQDSYILAYPQSYFASKTDAEVFKTSLNGKGDGYSNPYDKWLIYDAGDSNFVYAKNSNQELEKYPFKFDVVKAFANKYWDQQKSTELYLKSKKQKQPDSIYTIIKNVSDHAPIIIGYND